MLGLYFIYIQLFNIYVFIYLYIYVYFINDWKQIFLFRKTFARNGYPACVVYPFGSTVNGLAFKGCDLDLNVDLGKLDRY